MLSLVPLIVHLLEQLKLWFISCDNFIQLFVSEEFIIFGSFFIGIRVLVTSFFYVLVIFLYEFLKSFVSFLIRGLLVKHASLNNFVVQIFLAHSSRQNSLLDNASGDQTVNTHF